MTPGALQLALLCAAFWSAVLAYRGARPARFVAGLALGALCAHGGFALLHPDVVRDHPALLIDPTTGWSVLFVPLGLLALERSAAAFATLPLALAVARLGCVAAGCCRGPAGEATPLAEVAALLALHLAVRDRSDPWVVVVVLLGFGGLRLALEPWRAPPPLGPPIVPASVVAALWIATGAFIAASRALPPRAREGSA